MLINNLTLDEEEAVQEEFRELQALEAAPKQVTKLPDVPDMEPVYVKTPGTVLIPSLCVEERWVNPRSRTSSGGTGSGPGARSRIGCCTIYPRIHFFLL